MFAQPSLPVMKALIYSTVCSLAMKFFGMAMFVRVPWSIVQPFAANMFPPRAGVSTPMSSSRDASLRRDSSSSRESESMQQKYSLFEILIPTLRESALPPFFLSTTMRFGMELFIYTPRTSFVFILLSII